MFQVLDELGVTVSRWVLVAHGSEDQGMLSLASRSGVDTELDVASPMPLGSPVAVMLAYTNLSHYRGEGLLICRRL